MFFVPDMIKQSLKNKEKSSKPEPPKAMSFLRPIEEDLKLEEILDFLKEYETLMKKHGIMIATDGSGFCRVKEHLTHRVISYYVKNKANKTSFKTF